MYHGEQDDLVGVGLARKSYEIMRDCGLNVTFRTVRNMGHSAVYDPELLHVARFLNEQIPP